MVYSVFLSKNCLSLFLSPVASFGRLGAISPASAISPRYWFSVWHKRTFSRYKAFFMAGKQSAMASLSESFVKLKMYARVSGEKFKKMSNRQGLLSQTGQRVLLNVWKGCFGPGEPSPEAPLVPLGRDRRVFFFGGRPIDSGWSLLSAEPRLRVRLCVWPPFD